MSLSVAVPVFNNAGSLLELNQRLRAVLNSIDTANEIVYVNDGSTDNSFDLLVDIHATNAGVKVVDLEGNYGQSSAILAAMSVASGSIIITIDADLENHPEDIPGLVAALLGGADLACGVRQRQTAVPLRRRIPSWFANQLVARGLGINLRDWGCGLNAVRRDITRQILRQTPLPTLPKIEAALLSSRIEQVPVAHSNREHGPSAYTLWRLLGFTIAFFRSFSVLRTFRRLWVRQHRDGTRHRPPIGREQSAATWLLTLPLSVLAWSVLSTFAILVRFGLLFTGSFRTTERFRIREVLD